jgi:AcrR family transcriptional regulator
MNMRSPVKTDQTRTNLLDSVERLSARGAMSAITMRAIAAEADCSLGLAYRYFDTKDELLGAVLDRAANYITTGLEATDSPGDLTRQAWKRMAERPVFARLLTWMILEGGDITEVMTGHPFLQTLGQQTASLGDADPRSAAAAIGIITIGGGLFTPAINRAAGNQPDDEAVYERLTRAVELIPTASSPPSALTMRSKIPKAQLDGA